MKRTSRILILAGALANVIALSATANIIQNGSFEEPSVSAGTYYSGITPTYWTGGAFLFNSVPDWPDAQDGFQYEDIGNATGTPSLSQTFVISSGGIYCLSWYDNTYNLRGYVSPYQATITAGGQLVATSGTLDANHGGSWHQQALVVTLAPGSYTLAFTPLGHPGGLDSLVDNVTLVGCDEGIEVSGRVLRSDSRLPLAGASVTLAGKNATTDSSGRFSFTDLAFSTGNLLTVSKPAFATHTEPITLEPGKNWVVLEDIYLPAAIAGKPVVTALRAKYQGLFLAGIAFQNEYTACVDWGANTPNRVEFSVNGALVQSVPTVGSSATATVINMGKSFYGSYRIGANRVSAVAVGAGNEQSEPRDLAVNVIPSPLILLQNPVAALQWASYNQPKWTWSFEVPDFRISSEFLKTLPILNDFGLNFSLGFYGEYTPATGEWKVSGGSKFGAQQKKPIFKLSELDIEFTTVLYGGATASIERGLVPVGGAECGLKLEHPIYVLHLTDAVVPGIGPVIGAVSEALKPYGLDPSSIERITLYGFTDFQLGTEFVLDPPPLKFDARTFSMDIGIRAAYEPDAVVFKGEIYVGGKVGAEVQVAPTLALSKLSAQVFGGIKFTLWVYKIADFEFALINYEANFPTAAAQSGAFRAKGLGELGWVCMPLKSEGFSALDRAYLAAGPEQCVAHDRRMKSVDGPSAMENFCLLSRAPVKGAAMPGSALPRKSGGLEYAVKDCLPCSDTNQVDLPLVQNVFPGSQPAMAARGQELILLHVMDNGSSNPLQFTDINWTRWDGTNWSVPVAIRTNTQAEFAPQVRYDGNGDAIAVWERVADPNFTNVDLTAMAAQMEIVWSGWSRTNGVWSEPVALTANSVLDHAPLLCGPMSDGSVLAVWTRNQANLLMGTNASGADDVLWAQWNAATRSWATPQALLTNVACRLSQSLAGTDGHAVYAWTKDGDGVLTDDTDQEVFYCEWTNGVWSAAKQLTTNTVADKNVRAAVAADGTVYLAWQSETNLLMSRNFSTNFTLVRSDSQTAGFTDYALTLGPSGNLVLLWQEMSTNGSDAHYMVYDPASDTWSKDMLLCADPPLERSFAPVWDDVGNLTVAYNKVQIVYTNKTVTLDGGGTVTITNVPQPDRVDLVVTKRALVKDLALLAGDSTVNGVNWLPGDPLTLTALVRNAGDVAVSNAVVAFYDGNPTNGGVLITNVAVSGWLEGAGTNTVSALWVVPEPATNHVLYAMVDPAGTVTEFNEANNMQSLSIGGTDLAVSLVSQSAETNGAVRVIALVQNLGAPRATNTVLAIRRDGETAILATNGVPALDPGRLAQVALDLPAGTQPAGEVIYQLSADDTRVVPDVNTNNNTTRFAVNLWIDSDADGIPDNWTMQYFAHATGQAGDLTRAQDDADGDGVSNLAEYRAGTNPTNALSYLRIQSISVGGTNGVQVAWGSTSNRLYSVLRASVLATSGAAFTNLAEHILSTPPENVFFDTTATNANRFFYRIKVE